MTGISWEWVVAIVIVTVLGTGCQSFLPTDPELQILQAQFGAAKENINKLEGALVAGNDLSQAAKDALLAQIQALKDQQDQIEVAIAKRLEGAGIPPELAAGGGGLGAALIAWLIGMAKGQLGTAKKLKSTRSDLYARVTGLENGGKKT